MSGHRTKRQFAGAASDPAQRRITSFWPLATGDSEGAHYNDAVPQPSIPLLPAVVQSNLLSVGMRVRKSVPEGYKTGSAYSSFALWSDDNAGTGAPSQASANQTSTLSTPKELLPFCGIHRVGGLSAQSESSSVLFPAGLFDAQMIDGEILPELTSSQSTIQSSQSSVITNPSTLSVSCAGTTNRKRIFAEDERPDHPKSWRDSWLDGDVSPRTPAPAGWTDGPGNRAMAVPSSRRRDAPNRKSRLAPSEGEQENAEGGLNEEGPRPDFEEADFLDTRAWGNRDVQMGDF